MQSTIAIIDATAAVALAVRGWSGDADSSAIGAHAATARVERPGRRRVTTPAFRRAVLAGEGR